MIPVKEIVLSLLASHSSAGATKYSVESADYCMRAFPPVSCTQPVKWSSYYGGWVHQERRETALARFEVVARELDHAAQELLCTTEAGRDEDCVPSKGVDAYDGRRRWSLLTLELAGLAIAMLESGFREDVQTGRGRAGKPSDDGGEGRGAAGEACFVQAHPVEAWRWASGPDAETLERAKNGDQAAREAVMQTMVGRDPAAVRECWLTGLRMLIHSRAYCEWWAWDQRKRYTGAPEVDWDFAMFSMYGTGNSCVSGNEGKTMARVRMFRIFYDEGKRLRSAVRSRG